jgi:hypothetical protein
MDNFQEFLILGKMLDSIEHLQQRDGIYPDRNSMSSSQRLRSELANLTDKCRSGEITGRARRRKSGEIFRRIISLAPDIWHS